MKKQVIRGLISGAFWSKYHSMKGILFAKRYNENSKRLNEDLKHAIEVEPCEIITIYECDKS